MTLMFMNNFLGFSIAGISKGFLKSRNIPGKAQYHVSLDMPG